MQFYNVGVVEQFQDLGFLVQVRLRLRQQELLLVDLFLFYHFDGVVCVIALSFVNGAEHAATNFFDHFVVFDFFYPTL